jgi:hypothetical protein
MKTMYFFKNLRSSVWIVLFVFVAFACRKKDDAPVIRTDVSFCNPVLTDIYITIDATTQTIKPGESVTFYGIIGNTVVYYAYTSGHTTSGSQVGEKIEWNGSLTLSGGTASYNLDVSSSYFLIYVTNNGSDYLSPFYVNYGLTSQTVDKISIANDGVKYRIGYYKAWTNTNVRAYLQNTPTTYVYWESLDLPWTVNQSISLTYSITSKCAVGNKVAIENANNQALKIDPLVKASENIKYNSKAINLYCR